MAMLEQVPTQPPSNSMQGQAHRRRHCLRDQFPETSLTLLAKARKGLADGERARNEFAKRYFRPIHEFFLALAKDEDKADELSQEFFVKLCQPKSGLLCARPEKGAFRDFLMSAARNFLIDDYRSSARQKDGRPIQAVEEAIAASSPDAEASFHRAWVQMVLFEALDEVKGLCSLKNQKIHFALFSARYLSDAERPPSWEELGKPYNMDQKTARERADVVVSHYRHALRRALRHQIFVTGDGSHWRDDGTLDEEIQRLLLPLNG